MCPLSDSGVTFAPFRGQPLCVANSLLISDRDHVCKEENENKGNYWTFSTILEWELEWEFDPKFQCNSKITSYVLHLLSHPLQYLLLLTEVSKCQTVGLLRAQSTYYCSLGLLDSCDEHKLICDIKKQVNMSEQNSTIVLP